MPTILSSACHASATERTIIIAVFLVKPGGGSMNRAAKELFHQVVDLPPAEREVWFRQHSVKPELRAEVERVLAFDGADPVITDCVAASAEHLSPRGRRT
jgi:hypothetical protein